MTLTGFCFSFQFKNCGHERINVVVFNDGGKKNTKKRKKNYKDLIGNHGSEFLLHLNSLSCFNLNWKCGEWRKLLEKKKNNH